MNLRPTSMVLNDAFGLAPIGSHLQMTACTAATTLTAPAGARKLLIQATGSVDVRYTLDGSTPTSSKGFVIVHDDPPIAIPVCDGATIVVIEEAANATIDYQWAGVRANA